MATGGIDSVAKMIALQEAGASLFGLATALVTDLYCIPRLNAQWARYQGG